MSEPRTRKPLVFRYIDRLSELSGYISGALMLAAMLVICYGVLLRYFFGVSTIWQTELSIYFLMFAAFVGGAYGLKHGDHVSVDILVNQVSGRKQVLMRLLAAILSFVLIATVGVIASVLWWETFEAGRGSGTAWNPPLAYPYFIVPLGMALIGLQYLSIAFELLQELRSGWLSEQRQGESEERVQDEGERLPQRETQQ